MQQYRERDDVRFVVVYQREPHARQLAFDAVPQPKDYAERVTLARKTLDELNLDVDVWVDDMGDQSRALFGDLPSSAIVVGPLGQVRLKLPWSDPAALARSLPELRAELPDELPAPADAGFLAAVTGPAAPDPAAGEASGETSADPAAAHHRAVRLAHLAATRPEHPDRARWLDELARTGPEWQRRWVERMRETPPR